MAIYVRERGRDRDGKHKQSVVKAHNTDCRRSNDQKD